LRVDDRVSPNCWMQGIWSDNLNGSSSGFGPIV
jgi:hypothetical protein